MLSRNDSPIPSTWRSIPTVAASTAVFTATPVPPMPTWAIRPAWISKPGWWPGQRRRGPARGTEPAGLQAVAHQYRLGHRRLPAHRARMAPDARPAGTDAGNPASAHHRHEERPGRARPGPAGRTGPPQRSCRHMSVTTLDAAMARSLEPRAAAPGAGWRRCAALPTPACRWACWWRPSFRSSTTSPWSTSWRPPRRLARDTPATRSCACPGRGQDLVRGLAARPFPGSRPARPASHRRPAQRRRNDPNFGSRMRGTGIWADLLRQRFPWPRTRWA